MLRKPVQIKQNLVISSDQESEFPSAYLATIWIPMMIIIINKSVTRRISSKCLSSHLTAFVILSPLFHNNTRRNGLFPHPEERNIPTGRRRTTFPAVVSKKYHSLFLKIISTKHSVCTCNCRFLSMKFSMQNNRYYQ